MILLIKHVDLYLLAINKAPTLIKVSDQTETSFVVSYKRNDGGSGGTIKVTVDTGDSAIKPVTTDCDGDSTQCQLNNLDKYTTYLISAEICPVATNPHCSLPSTEIRDRTIFGGKKTLTYIDTLLT